MNCTFGAKVALESSWGDAFPLADPSSMEGSSRIKSFAPEQQTMSDYWNAIEYKVQFIIVLLNLDSINTTS